MYTPTPHREQRPEVLRQFLRDHPLGMLVSVADGAPRITHLPLHLDPGAGFLRGHLARANPHWETLDGAQATVVFRGEEHYVSPSWYATKREDGKVVPTWNYIAVEITGRVRITEDAAFLLRNLNELTDENEAGFAEPWNVGDAPERYIDGRLRAIVGVEIAIETIEGKWKLSQNRPDADQEGVIAGLKGIGSHRSLALAEVMERRRLSGNR